MTITLDGTTGITTPAETVSGAVTASTVTATGLISGSTNYTGFKNKIIGGDFTTNPWQRGTSFAAIAHAAYFADRWATLYTTNAVVTASKAADAPTASQAGIFTQHCISLAVTTADTAIAVNDRFVLSQLIEGLNTASFGFGQAGSRNVTLSFWVKGTKTGIHCVAIRNSAANRSYVAEYTIVTTNAWEYKTITIPVDTAGTWLYDNGVGLQLTFALMAGTYFQTTANTWSAANAYTTANQVNALDSTANVFKIALVQLEAGSVATSFDVRSVGTELALCQRYYEIGNIGFGGQISTASGNLRASISFMSVKRAWPTMVFTGAGTNFTNGVVNNDGSTIYQARAYADATSTSASGYWIANYTSSAEL